MCSFLCLHPFFFPQHFFRILTAFLIFWILWRWGGSLRCCCSLCSGLCCRLWCSRWCCSRWCFRHLWLLFCCAGSCKGQFPFRCVLTLWCFDVRRVRSSQALLHCSCRWCAFLYLALLYLLRFHWHSLLCRCCLGFHSCSPWCLTTAIQGCSALWLLHWRLQNPRGLRPDVAVDLVLLLTPWDRSLCLVALPSFLQPFALPLWLLVL